MINGKKQVSRLRGILVELSKDVERPEVYSGKEVDIRLKMPFNVPNDCPVNEVPWPGSWHCAFNEAEDTIDAITDKIKELEEGGEVICPLRVNIYKAFWLTPLEDVKVVIIGQDPYHTVSGKHPVAQGLSFSVEVGGHIPPSLKMMHEELKRSIRGFKIPKHGSLEPWARRGVLMLNMSLMVIQGRAGSLQGLWEGLIREVIQVLIQQEPQPIFLCMGRKSEAISKHARGRLKTICVPHPSPLAAASGRKFVGSDAFVLVNAELENIGLDPIDWTLDSTKQTVPEDIPTDSSRCIDNQDP